MVTNLDIKVLRFFFIPDETIIIVLAYLMSLEIGQFTAEPIFNRLLISTFLVHVKYFEMDPI